MNLHELVSNLIINTKGVAGGLTEVSADSSLAVFSPELTLCVTIVLMLLVRMTKIGRRFNAFYIALIGTVVALFLTAPWVHLVSSVNPASPESAVRMEIFTGMLVYDTFSVFVRTVLIGFAVLFLIFTRLSGIPDKEDSADIYALVLGATLGMCLMASANHLMMVFMAVEMASVPSYALAGMLKGRKKSSEAALKYVVYGAGAAGVMLYGISLLAGLLNSAHLPTMALQLAEKLQSGVSSEEVMVLAFASILVGVGLAFKLSAVPFHFWCPDVFEGAAAEVGAFLSIASKAAALALLLRVALGFGAMAPEAVEPGARTAAIAAHTDGKAGSDEDVETQPSASDAAGGLAAATHFVALQEEAGHEAAEGAQTHNADAASNSQPSRRQVMAALAPVRDYLAKFIALMAVITCTFGNLAAYSQTNIKRLMAYSTIAHAGYMMMAFPAILALTGVDSADAKQAIGAICIYIAIYLFMNLGAFAVIAFMRNAMGSEEIKDYGGLIRRQPAVVVCFTLILVSLVGLPPFAGFIGKFAIFAALIEAYQHTGHFYLVLVLVFGGLNTAISLYYYLRVIKTMTIDPEPEDRPPINFSSLSLPGVFMGLTAGAMVVLFLFWNGLNEMARAAAQTLLS